MIPLLTREESRAIDSAAEAEQGIPGRILMENAGRGAADLAWGRFDASTPVVVGGVGQNGGDGWVVARHLKVSGASPRALLIGSVDHVKGDAGPNLEALVRLGIPLEVIDETNDSADTERRVLSACSEASLVVDGLFGTGLARPVDGRYAAAIRAINRVKLPVLSLDIPSGVNADSGAVLGVAVRATVTATFAGHKRGLHQEPGAVLAGEVRQLSIGACPPPVSSECPHRWELSDVARAIRTRPSDVHKGVAGRVLVVGGAVGRTGAAVLAAQGAHRAGAGLVTIAAPGEAQSAIDAKVVEVMSVALSSKRPLVDALALSERVDAVVVGPGLGLDEWARRLALGLALEAQVPTVLDADALTCLAESDGGPSLLTGAAGPRVLTPHPGEAARLLSTSVESVQSDRWSAGRSLSEETGSTVLLKGAISLVSSPEAPQAAAGFPHAALGSGGTGDVLAGVVGALLVHLDPHVAAGAAATLHSWAGRLGAVSDRGFRARDLAAALPRALEHCRNVVPAGPR